MKLMIAILKDDDVENAVQALTSESFRVTRVASTGGFFRKGSTTLLIGVEDDHVDAAIALLRANTTASGDQKRATIFVVPVTRFEQL
ncbi:MAG: cyclic-di-AMP receptor [Anaerolineales bacterium]|nr:cyclic-di-AMP receptor [Anaerolineales bacterium]MCX7755304.1 cyclic-di-AMP receptor [Anaerolineales bacterium]MDW8278450.1 cyclic-di-AMP receptor [Anaerolineales bacterium]